MSLLIESIKIESHHWVNLARHEKRMELSIEALFGMKKIFQLDKMIGIPEWLGNKTYKCRIEYGPEIEKTEFLLYTPKTVRSLKFVESDLDYSFKFKNRQAIDELLALKKNCDDILIVKEGLISDTSFSNICFYNPNQQAWLTPGKPLLKGTKRQFYLENKIIFEKDIKATDLPEYSKACLINAMLDLSDKNHIAIERII